VSPAVTAADDDKAPDHRQFPELLASQADQWLYVSVFGTLVHVTAADEANEPLAAVENETV